MTTEKGSKNSTNIILVVAGLLLLVAVVVYSWNKDSGDKGVGGASNCNVTVKPGTAADVNKIGKNEMKLTTENFNKEVLQAKGVVMVDAYAPWCPHCQRIAPTISKIADDYAGKIKVGRLNADNQDPATKANFDFAIKNGLQGYPTIWFYKDGKLVESFSGEKTYCEIKEILDKYVQ